MQDTLFYVGIVCAILAGGFLVTSVIMFFRFRIPTLWKDSKGTLEQRQIEEIRSKNSAESRNKNKVNVFEELEKKAKVKKGNTHSLNLNPSTASQAKEVSTVEQGTMVLQSPAKTANPDFVIEKNLVFVSTSEVI